MEGGHRARSQGGAAALEGDQPHPAAAQPGQRRQLLLGGVDPGQDRVGVADQHPARVRQAHAAAATLDQLGAGLALQGGHVLRDRRLGEVEGLGRRGERAARRDLAQDPHSANVEHKASLSCPLDVFIWTDTSLSAILGGRVATLLAAARCAVRPLGRVVPVHQGQPRGRHGAHRDRLRAHRAGRPGPLADRGPRRRAGRPARQRRADSGPGRRADGRPAAAHRRRRARDLLLAHGDPGRHGADLHVPARVRPRGRGARLAGEPRRAWRSASPA